MSGRHGEPARPAARRVAGGARQLAGRVGESMAAEFLRLAGYEIVARNERRLRSGKEPVDVEAEIARQLSDLENLGQ